MNVRSPRALISNPSRVLPEVATDNNFFLVAVVSLAGLDLSLWLVGTGWLPAVSLGLW